MNRRQSLGGFTLIEILVVIAIIALLVGILLPALAEARQSGRSAKSMAHLHSNAALISTYANENKEWFVNPFTESVESACGPQDWLWTERAPCFIGWVYGESLGASTQGTETFGYHYLAHLMYAQQEGVSRMETITAPGDLALKNWLKDNNNQNAQSDWEWIFPSSYWYPPVFWMSPRRFASNSRPPATAANKYYISRNKFSDVTFPSGKVFLFEGKDYESKKQPMWFDATARPHVALVDASAQRVVMGRVISATSTSAVTQPGKIPMPSGLWNPGENEMDYNYQYGRTQGFDWTYGGAAYFWATRDGIRGRDLP